MSRAVKILIALGIGLVIAASLSYTLYQPDGEDIFHEQGCIRCHAFQGIGLGAIILNSVSERWSDDRLRDQIQEPKRNNPSTAMPNFGHLSEKEVDALIKFLKEGP